MIGPKSIPKFLSSRLMWGLMPLGLLLLVWEGNQIVTWYDLGRADAFLQKGMPMLAADLADASGSRLVNSDEGCLLLTKIYFQTHAPERLQWATQTCLSNGIKSYEIYLARAAALEMEGEEAHAQQILEETTREFKVTPDAFYRLSFIYRKSHQEDRAVQALSAAAALAPKNMTVQTDALTYLSSLGRLKEARQIALRLRDTPVNDPELKRLISRAADEK